MATLVVNGEPIYYGGDSYGPNSFRVLVHQVEGDDGDRENPTQERVHEFIKQSYTETNERAKRLDIRMTEKTFKFVAPDCVHDHPVRRCDQATVEVLKKDRWGNVYRSEKAITGCKCGDCDDVNLFNTVHFLRERVSVKFNV